MSMQALLGDGGAATSAAQAANASAAAAAQSGLSGTGGCSTGGQPAAYAAAAAAYAAAAASAVAASTCSPSLGAHDTYLAGLVAHTCVSCTAEHMRSSSCMSLRGDLHLLCRQHERQGTAARAAVCSGLCFLQCKLLREWLRCLCSLVRWADSLQRGSAGLHPCICCCARLYQACLHAENCGYASAAGRSRQRQLPGGCQCRPVCGGGCFPGDSPAPNVLPR